MKFLNDKHKDNLTKLIIKAKTSLDDLKRASFFYIISGNKDLFTQVNKFYDFEDGSLKVKWNEEGDFYFDDTYLSSSESVLIDLAIQLYNGKGNRNVMQIFKDLDSDSNKLALESIGIRFRVNQLL